MYVIVEAHYAVYMYVHKRRLPSNRKLLAGIVFLVADFDKECEFFFSFLSLEYINVQDIHHMQPLKIENISFYIHERTYRFP